MATRINAPKKTPATTRKATTAARAATAAAKRRKELDDEAAELVEELEGDVLTGRPVEVVEGDDDDVVAERRASSYYRPDRTALTVGADLSFTSTVKDREAEGVGHEVPFKVDGEVYIARRPVDDVFVLLTTASASSTPMGDRVAAIVEFLAEVVDEGDQIRLRARLKDKSDNFGFTDLLEIMEKVVAKFPKRGPKQARAMTRAPRR